MKGPLAIDTSSRRVFCQQFRCLEANGVPWSVRLCLLAFRGSRSDSIAHHVRKPPHLVPPKTRVPWRVKQGSEPGGPSQADGIDGIEHRSGALLLVAVLPGGTALAAKQVAAAEGAQQQGDMDPDLRKGRKGSKDPVGTRQSNAQSRGSRDIMDQETTRIHILPLTLILLMMRTSKTAC